MVHHMSFSKTLVSPLYMVLSDLGFFLIFRPENFADVVLEHHLDVMTELIARDKNRPSVVMWSVANEPYSNLDEAGPYFQ